MHFIKIFFCSIFVTCFFYVSIFSQSSSNVDPFLFMLSSQVDQNNANLQKGQTNTINNKLSFSQVNSENIRKSFCVDMTKSDPEISVFIKVKSKNSKLEGIQNIKIGKQIGNIMTARVPISQLRNMIENEEIERIELGKPLEYSLNVSDVKVRATEARNAFQKKGEGIITIILDSGIDITNQDFKNSDGTTRILYLWDQTTTGTSPGPPLLYNYGREWNSTHINNGTCTEINDDEWGHGTHVAGIAAGNGRATGNGQPAETYVGMAPKADLIIVKLKMYTTNLVDGLLWAANKAADLNKPWVANMSLGTRYGPKDGTSLLEEAVFGVTNQSYLGKGRIIVISAGNEGYDANDPNKIPEKKWHASGEIVSNDQI